MRRSFGEFVGMLLFVTGLYFAGIAFAISFLPRETYSAIIGVIIGLIFAFFGIKFLEEITKW